MQQTRLKGVRIGVVLTGSHCTIGDVLPQINKLIAEGAEIYPILSYTVNETDNRFYEVNEVKEYLNNVTSQPIINTIVGAEPIGPKKMLDVVIVMPATGNTIAKMANGIADTPALMAIKAQLRNQRPVIIAISSNDALGVNAQNIGALLNMKNIFFVPFAQDDPYGKSTSMVASLRMVVETAICALQGKQIQPLVLGSVK
ncbi:MAG: dipicolinate synthase subunit B [Bacillota bacterium]|nr:dipicolinate synthase subunit B [Bacillota bacterium]